MTATPLTRLTALGVLAASAVAMQLIEAPLPRPLPWLKPGLATSTTPAAPVLFGLPSALLLVVVRQVAAILLMGTLLSHVFLLGLVGAEAAALTMHAVLRAGRERLGLVSVSAAGALANNLAQLATAAWLLGTAAVWYQLPLLMAAAVPSGLLIGLLTSLLLTRFPDAMVPRS